MKDEKARAETFDRLYQLLEELLETQAGSVSQRACQEMRQSLEQLQVEQRELADRAEVLERGQGALEAARDKYRDLYELAPVAYFTLDPRGLILEANRTGAGLLGADRCDLSGTDFSAYVAPDSRAGFSSYCQRAFANRTHQACELKLQSKDGRFFPAHLESIATAENGGDFRQLHLAVSDVTGHREVESSWSECEQRFKSLFDHASDGILLADIESKQLYSGNPAACQMLGYAREVIPSLRVPDIHPREALASVLELFEKQSRGELTLAQDIPLKRSDDTIFYADINAFPISWDGKRCLAGIFRDVTERKRAEEQRQQLQSQWETEHARFQAVLQYMPAGVVIAEAPSGEILLSNDQVAKIWGHPILPAKNAGQYDHFAGFHPDGRPYQPEECPLARAIQQGEVVIDEEIDIRRSDGSSGTILASAMPIRDRDWHIYAGVMIFGDITDRKRAALALQTSEEKYHQLFRTVSDAIMVFDAKTKQFVEVNEAALRLYGYAREEFLQLNHAAITAEPEQTAASFRQTLAGELTHIPLRYHRKKDGTVFPVEISASMFTLGHRQLFCGIIRDITRRLTTEKTLRESEEKFRTLAEESPNMIFINCQGRVVYANRKCEVMMGYSREEFYAADFDFLSLHAPESRALVQRQFARHRRGEQVEPCEYTLLTRDGRRIEVILTSTLIHYDGDQAILGILTDITEHKRLEKEVLEISAQEQSRIGQDLHDDLGQMLTGICFLTETLEQRLAQKPPGDVSPAVAQISQLVNQALAKTRSLTKVLCPVQLETDGLSSALKTLAANTEEFFGVSCRFHGQEPCVLVADRTVAGHLYRIAQEAVTNAVKHGQASRIAISLQSVGSDSILLTIEDDGVGLPADFEQAKGMGLRIMGYRAGMIAGTLNIKRAGSSGTRVRLQLPNPTAIP